MSTATVLFVDLSRFTALTDVHGDHAALDVADQFVAVASAAAQEHGGRLVKTLGDGALLAFDETSAAVWAADSTSRRLHDLDSMPEMTGGAATGSVIDRDGDVFGSTVNLAARLADLAADGELLVDDPTARVAAADGWQVQPLGPVEVEGLRDPRSLFRLLLCHPDDCVVDPVCGMRITPGASTPTLTRGDEKTWFCSCSCRDRHAVALEAPGG